MDNTKYKIFVRDTQVSLFPVCMIVDAWNVLYPKMFGIQPRISLKDDKKQMDYFIPPDEWKNFQQILTEKVIKNPQFIDNLIKKIKTNIKELNNFTERNFYKKDLSNKTNKELFDLYEKFCQIDIYCYAYGNQMFVFEFGHGYLSGQIRDILSERVKNEDLRKEYFNILTTSRHATYNYLESLDLLKFANKLYKSGIWKKIKNLPIEQTLNVLKQDEPNLYKQLVNHREKYLFVFYNWEGPTLSVQDFFLNVKDILSSGNPAQKLLIKKNEIDTIINRQEELFKKFKFNSKEKKIAQMASEIAFWQLNRKTLQWKSGWHIEWLLKEIAKRLFIGMNQVRYFLKSELKDALINNKINVDLLNERTKLLVYYYKNTKPILISGKKAKDFIDKYIIKEKRKTNLNELSGMPVYQGKAKGNVRIVNTVEQAKEMQKGEILVSYATSPLIVPAMRLASAILTQEGGLTCHAAIVSRELHIPSIVGIENLISNFKNGDRIEVNAIKGIIRRIK